MMKKKKKTNNFFFFIYVIILLVIKMAIIGIPLKYSKLEDGRCILYLGERLRRTVQKAGGFILPIVQVQDVDYLNTKFDEFKELTEKEKDIIFIGSDKEFKYEITEHIGDISESSSGWKKELNLISWNGANPKYDIRDWAPEHEKMGKGVTLTEDEVVIISFVLFN